jgi:hypothetical protein
MLEGDNNCCILHDSKKVVHGTKQKHALGLSCGVFNNID